MMLLVAIVTGAWAEDTTLYSYDDGTETKDASVTVSIVGSNVAKGYTGQKYNANSTTPTGTITFPNSIISSNAIANALKLEITGGFKKGDKISIVAYYNNSNTKAADLDLYADKDTKVGDGFNNIVNARTASGTPEAIEYTLTEDQEEMYIGRRNEDNATRVNILKIVVTRPQTKTVTSKDLTGINIDGEAWDISGLSGNAATISTAYTTLPEVEFVYTINYDDNTADENQKEIVTATKDGDNYVAASTELTNNVTLTFTNVAIEKQDAGLAYATSSITKKVSGATFTNALTNPNSVTVTYSITSNGTGSTVDASTGVVTVGNTATGTETITATFEGDDEYNAGTATYTLVVAEGTAQTTVSEATTWTWDNITPKDQIDYNPKPTFVLVDEDRLNFSNFGGAASAIKLIDAQRSQYKGKAQCAQAGGFTIVTTVAGTINVSFGGTNSTSREVWINGTKVKDYSSTDKTTTGEVSVPAGTVTVEFKETNGDATLGRIYSIEFTPATTETITIPSDGVLTYVTQNALDFSTINGAFKAYVPTSVNEAKTSVATAEVTSVPAGTALLLKGAAGAYDVEIAESATAPAANLFLVSDGNVQGADNIFAYHKTNKKFMKVDSSIKVPAGKCYLVIEGVSGDALDLDFEGEATAVEAIAETNEANAAAPVKVIKNGKLYIGNYNVAGQQVK